MYDSLKIMFEHDKVLFEGDTDLEHYQVVDMVYEGRKARVLFSGKRQAAFSGMPLDDQHELLFDYIQRLYELVAHTRPRKLLMIGGGVYTLPMALLQTLPDIHIDVVEIDAGLDAIAEGFFGYRANSRINLFHMDGRQFLEQSTQKYDMILIDAFSHLSIPTSLADQKSVELIYNHLSSNGIAAMNVISSYYGRRSEVIKQFYDLYCSVFNSTKIFPADSALSLWLSQNFILLGQKGRPRTSYGIRYGELRVEPGFH